MARPRSTKSGTRPSRNVRQTLSDIRRSQVISTYGIGGLIPVTDESFMVAGIDRWTVRASEEIHEPRLQRQLGVSRFYLPPTGSPSGDIPVVRFPAWSSCSSCRRIANHGDFCSYRENRCQRCDTRLTPSRFVAACINGHIQDFPYFAWIHQGPHRSESSSHELSITSANTSASLGDISAECSCGVPPRTLEGIFSEGALRGIKCSGNRPWLQDSEDGCTQTLRTLQRGASNVHFGIPRSAISIPPWSEQAQQRLTSVWRSVRNIQDDALLSFFRGYIADDWEWSNVGVSAEEFVDLTMERREAEAVNSSSNALADNDFDLKPAEYQALSRITEGDEQNSEFVVVEAPSQGPLADEWFEKVMLVKRLREVRVQTGFSRVSPYTINEPEERKAPLFRVDPGWLPAIEVKGEGVFLKISEKIIREFESRQKVQARVGPIQQRQQAQSAGRVFHADQVISPRYLVIHSLAHCLINQWSLECGYPTASLRERLYVSKEMAGILIYTATTDSAGSLGGVISLAETGRLSSVLENGIRTSSWCSSDPLCIESEATGVSGLNLAACHACMLLPEVSCETGNIFLDRAMLVGSPEDPDMGMFPGFGS